jgi:hypothetical protein
MMGVEMDGKRERESFLWKCGKRQKKGWEELVFSNIYILKEKNIIQPPQTTSHFHSSPLVFKK